MLPYFFSIVPLYFQQVDSFLCLLFGAGHVANSKFIRAFFSVSTCLLLVRLGDFSITKYTHTKLQHVAYYVMQSVQSGAIVMYIKAAGEESVMVRFLPPLFALYSPCAFPSPSVSCLFLSLCVSVHLDLGGTSY